MPEGRPVRLAAWSNHPSAWTSWTCGL